MDATESRRPDRLTLAGFGAVVLLAGGNLVAVRFSNRGLPPFLGAGIRFLVASALLFIWVFARRMPLPSRRELPATLLFGVLGFAGFYAFGYWALVYLPAGVVGVLAASVPLATVLLAAVHRLEKITARGVMGSAIAILGIVVMVGTPSATSLAVGPVLAVLASAVCDAEAAIVVKKLPTGHPVATNAVAMLTGGLLLMALSALWGEKARAVDDTTVWALIYLVLFGSIILFVLFLWTLDRWTASGLSYMFVLMPVVGALMGAWLLDEPITTGTLIGGGIVLAGVYVGALSAPRRPAHPRPEAAL